MPETTPLTPETPSSTKTTETPATTTPSTVSNNPLEKADEGTGRTYLASRGKAEERRLLDAPPEGERKEPTLTSQHKDPRFQPYYQPLEIMIHTGRYKGEIIELGLTIDKFSDSQNAEWPDGKGTGIRPGSNFDKISSRPLRFNCEFSALNEDVRQLSEALAHLQEITDESWTPPLLRILVGETQYFPVVSTDISWDYDEPMPGNIGWRHCSVSLSFKLLGGQGSPHQLAPPILNTKTYLQSKADRLDAAERERQGSIAVSLDLLAPCLGEEGSDQLKTLLEEKRLNDINALLNIEEETLLQIASGGLLHKDLLNDEMIKDRLSNAIADRVSRPVVGERFDLITDLRIAIKNQDPVNLPPFLTDIQPGSSLSIFDKLVSQHSKILNAVLNQDLDQNSEIFKSRSSNSMLEANTNRQSGDEVALAASQILRCGLNIRQTGAGVLAQPEEGIDAIAITTEGINRAIATEDTKYIRQAFGLGADVPETVVRRIVSGGPYGSKDEFLSHLTLEGHQINGYVLWQNFYSKETETLTKLNAAIADENISPDELAKRLKISKAEAEKIMGSRRPFESKQDFLERLNPEPGTSALQNPEANKAWQNYQKYLLENPDKQEIEL
jgi:hypothetical protein